jgi:hypothetical protein
MSPCRPVVCECCLLLGIELAEVVLLAVVVDSRFPPLPTCFPNAESMRLYVDIKTKTKRLVCVLVSRSYLNLSACANFAVFQHQREILFGCIIESEPG